MSYILFKETLNETETFRRIFDLNKPLYLLIDEFQYIFTNSELCDVVKHFFREISNAEVYYVAVGTFILVDLMKNDGEFIAPFNKAKFEKMPLFSIEEMDKLFESYQFSMNYDGVQPDLRVEIVKESCGHPASFMILLKLYHDYFPNILQWGKVLQANFSQYMNSIYITLQNEISKMSINEKRYIRSLTEYMSDCWKMDLSDLTAINDLDKKLLNIGILYPIDSNFVRFTSCIILRICIDILFSESLKLSEDKPKKLLKSKKRKIKE
jgi:hypothetical protein